MSRIGKTPIVIPDGVKVDVAGSEITVAGKLGTMSHTINKEISVEINEDKIVFVRCDDTRKVKALHGLNRALTNNMVIGVSKGYEKTLQVIGNGYNAEIVGPWIKMSLGYSHDILLEVPEGLNVKADAVPRSARTFHKELQSIVTVSGMNKEVVGHFCAEIRKCRPPENYKGKGIRYLGEHVIIKAGKAGAK